MGNQASTPEAAPQGGCPVQHDKKQPTAQAQPQREGGCPVQHDKPAASGGGCPVQHDKKDGGEQEIYNVYGQRIDPTNMMPYNPNQEPNDEQRYPLTQERVQSTIPKGGTEGTWLYPSEQMFFNALKRKGKGEDVHEGDVSTIVAIHNNMNERAWAQVEQYEKVCHPESDPKLLKFCGRPDTLTPIAWVKNVLGYGKPFDRHDWTILRSDNTQVRYVIDYYFDDEKATEDKVPELHSASSVKSISMYARPAIDSLDSLIDRIKFPVIGMLNGIKEADITRRAALVEKPQVEEVKEEPLSAAEVEATFGKIKESCRNAFQKVRTCESEIDCSLAATALQLCMGQIVCPTEAGKLSSAIEGGDQTQIDAAFEQMSNSLERFQERSATALREQAAREAAAAAASAKQA
ncbi:hypothetical protein PINS_up002297 [Pythium insidiosum]|nr:hypothetical protein PINS_up002297 [Pythium insidiosum]